MSEREDPIMAGIRAQVNESVRKMCDEAGQLSLGELLAKLEATDAGLLVVFSDGYSPDSFDSYRGYYDHIALSRIGKPMLVGNLVKLTRAAIGATFQGYKGGDYTMGRSTPVWVSEYGDSSGDGIVGVTVREDCVVLEVRHVEDD